MGDVRAALTNAPAAPTSPKSPATGNPSGNDQPDFATYTRDYNTGFEYANQRYYSAGYGRFLTVDPLGRSARAKNPGSWNRYSYAIGNPAGLVDPRGLLFEVPIDIPGDPETRLRRWIPGATPASRSMVGRALSRSSTPPVKTVSPEETEVEARRRHYAEGSADKSVHSSGDAGAYQRISRCSHSHGESRLLGCQTPLAWARTGASYDQNGNMTALNNAALGYDIENRLTS